MRLWQWLIPVLILGLILFLHWRMRRNRPSRFTSEAKKPRSGGPGLIRPGILELQHLIEPEKKVEILVQEEEDREDEEHSGAPP